MGGIRKNVRLVGHLLDGMMYIHLTHEVGFVQ